MLLFRTFVCFLRLNVFTLNFAVSVKIYSFEQPVIFWSFKAGLAGYKTPPKEFD